jgi:hypothetical protein
MTQATSIMAQLKANLPLHSLEVVVIAEDVDPAYDNKVKAQHAAWYPKSASALLSSAMPRAGRRVRFFFLASFIPPERAKSTLQRYSHDIR